MRVAWKLREPVARCVGVTPYFGKESAMRRLTPLLVAALLLTGLIYAAFGSATALEVGQKAPDFSLPAPGGKLVKLSDLTAKGPVVVFTFIQAFTSP
jgi:hypothetical protein